MSWASKRRFTYGTGIVLFFVVVFGIPFAIWIYKPPSCFDGKHNQEETAVDKGGPCALLNELSLIPHAIVWSRGFEVRSGLYSAVAYVENPNGEAGVRRVGYRFGLYDESNVLVAERDGETLIMPGGITPIFEGVIDTGNRTVVRTFVEFTEPLVWERMNSLARVLAVHNKNVINTTESPRITALATNESVKDITDASFVAVVFDTAGNAFAGSETLIDRVPAGETREIVFTWPTPFSYVVGRVDILPVLPPQLIVGN